MSTKKARRRERRRQRREPSHSRRNPATLFTMGIALVILLLVGAALIFGDRARGGAGPGAPPWPGAVWSADHGHWH